MLGQARSTQRYRALEAGDERRLVRELHALSSRYPRYGYRRITVLLRRAGWSINAKRVQRLWRREGLKVPRKQRRQRRLGHGANSCARRRAEYRNHVWAVDFTMDRTRDGRALRFLSVVDEHTRECHVLEVHTSLVSAEVREILRHAMAEHGTPRHLRCDNGPEFIAKALRQGLSELGVETLYIEPGSPWQNGYAESFHSRFKDELIDGEIFDRLLEARVLTQDWKHDYNHHRPHSALGYLTPAEFAAHCAGRGSASLRRAQPKRNQALSEVVPV